MLAVYIWLLVSAMEICQKIQEGAFDINNEVITYLCRCDYWHSQVGASNVKFIGGGGGGYEVGVMEITCNFVA